MPERLVSEAITPVVSTCDSAAMAAGGPGLPREFRWRGKTLRVLAVVRTWRETGSCRHGSGERYVRKHWFEVVTDQETTLKLYFERQPRGRRRAPRWWLYSETRAADAAGEPTSE